MRLDAAAGLFILALGTSCSDSDGSIGEGSGGSGAGTGGSTSTGGTWAGTGGSWSSGGTPSSGGTTAGGGTSGSAGATPSGGTTASGGSAGSSGGTSGAGGGVGGSAGAPAGGGGTTGGGGSGGSAGSASCGSVGSVSCTQNQFGVTFTNTDGDWVIYKGCYGPKARGGGTTVTVGPGYIARVVLKKATPGGTVITNDEQDDTQLGKGHLNGTGYGGLGAFGWHHARGNAPFTFNGNNAWGMEGRFCAEDHGGFGVAGATVIDGPAVDASGVGRLGIDVVFTDAWTTAASPLMRVRYRYQIHPTVVKMWAVVTELCGNGSCGAGAPGLAFIKEPKFVMAVTGGGYTRGAIFNAQGVLATNSVSNTPYCSWLGIDPTKSTGQCDGDGRARARFDYGTTAADQNGGCDAVSKLCLNGVMRAYSASSGDVLPGAASTAWEGSGQGLDQWAVVAAARQAANPTDSAGGGAQWACHGGSTSQAQQRRWEIAGGPKNAQGQYQAATVMFHAWEGGTGAYDCEPLSRRFGPAGESFAVHGQFSINDGWGFQ